jgi:hypothetical protein
MNYRSNSIVNWLLLPATIAILALVALFYCRARGVTFRTNAPGNPTLFGVSFKSAESRYRMMRSLRVLGIHATLGAGMHPLLTNSTQISNLTDTLTLMSAQGVFPTNITKAANPYE